MPTSSEFNTFQSPLSRANQLRAQNIQARAGEQSIRQQEELQAGRLRGQEIQNRAGEIGIENRQIQNQQLQAEVERFGNEENMRSMAQGALEFLNIDPQDINTQNQFLQKRAREIAARGGDPQDTIGMFSLSPEQRQEAATRTIQLAQQMGIIAAPQQASSARIQTTKDAQGFVRNVATGERLFPDVEAPAPRGPLTQVTVEGDKAAIEPTAFEKKVDERAAQVVLDWTTGGRNRAKQNVSEFQRIKGELESGRINTRTLGDFLPFVSDEVRKLFNEPAAEAVNDIRSIAFQVLRETLGAQFTEKEGERLMATYFDPQLSEEANIKRMGRLAALTEQLVDDKDRLATYMDKNRTAIGFKSIADDPMQAVRDLVKEGDKLDNAGDTAPEGVDPEDWKFFTDEQKKLWR